MTTHNEVIEKIRSDLTFELIDKLDEAMASYIENSSIESYEYEYDMETNSLKMTVEFIDEDVTFEIRGASK